MNNLSVWGKPASRSWRICLAVAATLVIAIAGPNTAPAAPNAQYSSSEPAFEKTWDRTDQLVQLTSVQRSYYWGFTKSGPFYERYDEGAGGEHLVQYFDKARMEINDPNGDPNNPFFVTNGQLSRELVTGRVQVGKNNFVQLEPAQIDIASDNTDTSPGTPTYASFHNLIRSNPQQTGSDVTTTINRAGQEGSDPSYASAYHVSYAYYEPATQNNIPNVFWDFLNLTGPVTVDGKTVNARLSDPYFYVTGYPISGAYWAQTTIAGTPNTAVLIQVYERRVLTYVPSAPEAWRVQMGNVGAHYVDWRYNATGSYFGPGACQNPGGKTGALWFARPDVQHWVGCAAQGAREQGMTVAHQFFQHGEMLDLINGLGLKTIYVLFDGGTAQPFQDTYNGEPEPTPAVPAPQGLYTPQGGFGKVWRENNMEPSLGWATAPETVATYNPKTEPAPPSPVPTSPPGVATPTLAPPPPTVVPPSTTGFPAVLSFGSESIGANLIIYAGPTLARFYVTYDFGRRWAGFEDTSP